MLRSGDTRTSRPGSTCPLCGRLVRLRQGGQMYLHAPLRNFQISSCAGSGLTLLQAKELMLRTGERPPSWSGR